MTAAGSWCNGCAAVSNVGVFVCLSAVGEDGELPPELAKHDPRLIEAVCNDVSC